MGGVGQDKTGHCILLHGYYRPIWTYLLRKVEINNHPTELMKSVLTTTGNTRLQEPGARVYTKAGTRPIEGGKG